MLKKILPFGLALLMMSSTVQSQSNEKSYTDKKGNIHLCGPFDITTLESDTTYNAWYQKNYEAFELTKKAPKWKKQLKNTEVDIYLGTWCGDSKTWVPQFVKLWDELGLDRAQLHFIALYNGDEKYKQGPNGEEKGKNIHRVPTFIFKEDGQEVARIVEHPQNGLERDVAQIALGVPSEPSYKAANYLMHAFNTSTVEEVRKDYRLHVNKAYRLQKKSSELNTLGYVYLRAGEIDKALLVFHMNTLCNRYIPNVYDSYGEALEIAGQKEEALAQYKKVLEIDPNHENALAKVKELENEEIHENRQKESL